MNALASFDTLVNKKFKVFFFFFCFYNAIELTCILLHIKHIAKIYNNNNNNKLCMYTFKGMQSVSFFSFTSDSPTTLSFVNS